MHKIILAFAVTCLWQATVTAQDNPSGLLLLKDNVSDKPTCKCETYGTTVNWYDHKDAWELAKQQKKPVVLLHLSGNFRKASYT